MSSNFETVVPYGVICSTKFEFFQHIWYLIYGIILTLFYNINNIKLNIYNEIILYIKSNIISCNNNGNIILSHSCRTIFYSFIKTIINKKRNELKKLKNGNYTNLDDKITLNICCTAIQFGSFYRILNSIKNIENININYYNIDYNMDNITINYDNLNENILKTCDVIIIYNIFGVPSNYHKLFKLGILYHILLL